ncbi:protein phosphatase 1 regulatory subunit 37 [Ceratina calcarata]|uniref:Protein phosphatase 1 regulatory subunit 37 n=1 Tax=Ceratina calcarata TaxID=156304 RepID=A0AAJ7IY48_9HYME|nr:protein phosphatase 1 regulatory subunit 37 [Ceratina calcarata]
MSEGASPAPRTCENSLTTLTDEVDPEELPPRTISHTTRRPRFGTGNVPLSPYILIDGRKLRSSLALSKKKLPRRVSFPTNDNHLITGYLEPANPLKLAENANREDIISAYKESCLKHNSEPLATVVNQLENLSTFELRNEELNLKGETLDVNHAEPLEEIFKRVQFNKVDLEDTSLSDESSVILFDMLEYYESAKQLNISLNQDIGIHGWQACANMIRKTRCLEHLEAKDVILNEQYMNILSRDLRLNCQLHVLKLENCGLSGRCIVALVAALKVNTGIRELYLADNGLNLYDAIQLGSLLRLNNHIQLLDISNNVIQDDGVRDILEGLINQIKEDEDGKGLSILILWNNQLTKKSGPSFARIIGLCKTLETLNIGKNLLTDDTLVAIKDALKKNRVLLQLGMQSTDLTCDGVITLSDIIETNQVLQRIDLRNNDVRLFGLEALSLAMKKNRSITKIDLDERPDAKIDRWTEILPKYTQLLAEIRSSCLENEQNRALEETNEGFDNSYHSRFCSTTSRKISLTCQTLPCSPSSMISSGKDERSMLEPKRVNGGRLRSPAPSPASSPVASPILSPSRSRFVVSRVPETLRPTDCSSTSSTTSSSVVLSSPACVTSASGSSRFRVSVVESANTVSLPKITTTEADIDLNTKIKADDDDNDDVSDESTKTNENQRLISDMSAPPNTATDRVKESVAVRSDEDATSVTAEESQIVATTTTTTTTTDIKTVDENTEVDAVKKVTSDEVESQVKHDPIQKSSSNLGKLLSLFQHSSCFFSDSVSINQLKSKSTLQGSINSMMTLGDKFHYYIKDKRDRIYSRETEEKKSKFFNVSQLPSLQSLANIIPSFRVEGQQLSAPGSDEKPCIKETSPSLEKDNDEGKERERTEEKNIEESFDVPALDKRLPEGMKSKLPAGVTNKDVVLAANCIVSNIIDTCSKLVNDNLLTHVPNSNTIVPVPKLLGIPEYSAYRAARNDVQRDTADPDHVQGSTDSINFTSDSNSLSCSIAYGDDSRMHNLILNLSTKEDDSAFTVNNTGGRGACRNAACFACSERKRVNKRSTDCYVGPDRLNSQVTRTCSTGGDKDVYMDDLQAEDSPRVNRNDVVNSRSEAEISNVACVTKDRRGSNVSVVLPLPRIGDMNKLLLSNFINRVSRISINGTPVKRISISGCWPNNAKVRTLFCDLSQIPQSDDVTELEESGDSRGVVSVPVHSIKNEAPRALGNFAQRSQCTNSDEEADACQCLNAIVCTSTAAANTIVADSVSLTVASDPSANIAETSPVIRATSTK